LWSINERREQPLPRVFGIITTGSLRKFRALETNGAFLDPGEYHISDATRVLGALVGMLGERKP
jgi:hypothetical protein